MRGVVVRADEWSFPPRCGPWNDKPADDPRPNRSLPAFTISGCAAQHRGDRPEQQDRVAILRGRRAPRCVLGLLADGVGGRSGGALASDQVVSTAQRRFDEHGPDDAVERFFEDLVAEIHVVLQLAGATAALQPHSTRALVTVLVQPDRVDWCHVGDSRLYHVRDGAVVQRTVDDTLGERMLRERRMSADRVRLHPSRGLLTQALGGSRVPVPTFGSVPRPATGRRVPAVLGRRVERAGRGRDRPGDRGRLPARRPRVAARGRASGPTGTATTARWAAQAGAGAGRLSAGRHGPRIALDPPAHRPRSARARPAHRPRSARARPPRSARRRPRSARRRGRRLSASPARRPRPAATPRPGASGHRRAPPRDASRPPRAAPPPPGVAHAARPRGRRALPCRAAGRRAPARAPPRAPGTGGAPFGLDATRVALRLAACALRAIGRGAPLESRRLGRTLRPPGLGGGGPRVERAAVLVAPARVLVGPRRTVGERLGRPLVQRPRVGLAQHAVDGHLDVVEAGPHQALARARTSARQALTKSAGSR